jgi:hypothetical protein
VTKATSEKSVPTASTLGFVAPPRSAKMDRNPRMVGGVADPMSNVCGRPPMRAGEVLREKINANLPLIVFLGFYFVATVLANFIYHTALGEGWAQSSMIEASNFSKLPLMGTPGYWILLLMPFVMVPPLAIYSARVAKALVRRVSFLSLEFRRFDYVVITGAAYAYCYYEFRRADLDAILERATNDVFGSVAARFEIVETLGFWPLMVIKSVLIFLAVYSLIRAMRSREWFWIGAFLINLVVLSEMLIWLNMKWPVLIYYVALMLCIFLFSLRHPYLNTAIAAIGLGVVYLVISVMVLRSAEASIISRQIAARSETGSSLTYPPVEDAQPRARRPRNESLASPAVPPIDTSEYAAEVARKSVSLAPLLVTNALNRMALPYPYYYQVFTAKGPVCGTLIDRILRKTNPCHPSNLIYEVIYGKDRFGGKATAPAAVHITGYALGGWSGALIATVLASIVIGIFMGLWQLARISTLAAAVFVMGGYSAYFFSQLPFEGPIVYDHGMLWWAAVLVGYAGYRRLLAPVLSNAVFAPIGRRAAPILAMPGMQRAIGTTVALSHTAAESFDSLYALISASTAAAWQFVAGIFWKRRSIFSDSKTTRD